MSKALSVFFAAALSPAGAWAMGRTPSAFSAQAVAPVARWQGAFCSVVKPEEDVVANADEWAALWRKIGVPAPSVDLSKNFAAAVFLGTRPTGGYGVAFLDAAIEQGTLIIPYHEKKPSGMVFEALTQPYAVQLYPKTALPVRLENAAHGGREKNQ
ncbi:MAG TPA: protease complex subunit PrcB family protein [Elusimicrobiota bacterium]|nr:protease complex subunit PrcB family protein [Elusimicrobiota bacterium]